MGDVKRCHGTHLHVGLQGNFCSSIFEYSLLPPRSASEAGPTQTHVQGSVLTIRASLPTETFYCLNSVT